MKKRLISFTLIAAGFLLGATALSALAQTWTPPTLSPPNGNISAPVLTDTSGTPAHNQNRYGLLGLADLVVTDLNIASGTPGAGHVLVSDASGNATWSAAAAAGVSQITAGANILISPSSGTGNVTINGTPPGVGIGPEGVSLIPGLPAFSGGLVECPSNQVLTGLGVSCTYSGGVNQCTVDGAFCSSVAAAVYFGGMYATKSNGGAGVNNPLTGTQGCPAGYGATDISGGNGYFVCTSVVDSVTAGFGGMYDSAGLGNPAHSGLPSCPAGYAPQSLGSDPSGDKVSYCYETTNSSSVNSSSSGFFLGIYRTGDTNPVTGMNSCPQSAASVSPVGSWSGANVEMCY